MAFLNTVMSFFATAITPSVVAPGKMWHILILNTFSFIADYGWRIVVFTLLLKLVLSPLDFFQRYKMNKNQKITERLKPTMERIQKQYAGDKQAISQKQMELNRKEGYSYFSSCLPMIATMVVFITLWLSMNTVAQFMTLKEYTTLYDQYTSAVTLVENQSDDHAMAQEIGQDVVYTLYYDGIDQDYVRELRERYSLTDEFTLNNSDKVQTSFLWIKNIWAADVPWGNKAILDWSSFSSAVGRYMQMKNNGLSEAEQSACLNDETYNRVMHRLLTDSSQSRVNGYLILPVLVVVLSVGSQLLTSMQQKKAGQVNAKGGLATGMKVMMFVMPVMMAIFAIQYASIFTLYMVTNTACTLFFNASFSGIIKLMDNRKSSRRYGIKTGSVRANGNGTAAIMHFAKGANPNAGAKPIATKAEETPADGEKKVKSKGKDKTQKAIAPVVTKKSGRPDPNELMDMDMTENNNSQSKKNKK